MWQAILTAVQDARIRVVAVALLLLGFTYASAFPFQSIIAINQLKIDEQHFALIILGIGIANMVGNIVLGALSDFAANRKTMVLACLLVGAAGYSLFAIFPSIATFLICLLLVTPLSGSAYALLFGTVRSITAKEGAAEAASINSAVRSFYALSWILVPGLVGLWIGISGRASDSFAIAALAFALCAAFYFAAGPDIAGGIQSSSSALVNLKDAAVLIFKDGRAPRLAAISMINSPHAVIGSIFPLVLVTQLGGTTAEVGWFGGLVALLEIPLMIAIAAAVYRFQLWAVILAGGAIHIMFLLLLGFTTTHWQLFVLALLNAGGNSVLLTQHMSYVQDLLPDRPGLGSSLLSIVSLVSRGLGALVFAGLSAIYGFTGALFSGAAICLAGCLMLALLDGAKGLARVTT